MPTISLKGYPLFYFQHKAKESRLPPVMLIHGAGGIHQNWPSPIRRLPGVNIYAPDLPGHGQSATEGRGSVADYAAVIRDLMDAIRLEHAVLIGHSMGAAIALQVALDAPERVVGLGLIGGSARMRVNPQLLEDALQNPEGVVQFIGAHGYSVGVDEKIRLVGGQNIRAIPPRVLHGDYLACDTFDIRDQLSRITAPALVVGSRQDQMVPPKFVESLAAGLPNAELHWIEGAGHMLPVEAPAEVASLIHSWLARFTTPD